MRSKTLLLLLLLLPLPALATPIVIEGRVIRDGAPVDDVTDVGVVARADGAVVLETTVSFVAIVDGVISFTTDVPEAADTVEVSYDSSVARVFVSAAAFAGSADSAASTPFANRADAVGALTAADVFSRAALGALDGDVVPLSGLRDVPAGLADGDDGNVSSVGAGLAVSETRLFLIAVGALLENGSVDSRVLLDGGVNATHVSTVGAADIAAGGLTGANFAPATFATANISGNKRSIFSKPRGCAGAEFIITSTCPTSTVGCTAGQRRNCSTGICEAGAVINCNAAALGQLLFQ